MPMNFGDPLNRLTEMLCTELDGHLIPAEDFIDMFAENGIMTFPYAPDDRIRKLEGRDAMQKYFEQVRGLIEISDFLNTQTYISQDGRTAVIEFECQGRIVATGRPYNQTYVSIIHLKKGKIISYKDYWNPLVLIDSLKEKGV